MLTIFTAPKAFTDHIGVIQRNAIRSWLALDSGIQVVLIGDEAGIADNAARLGVEHEPVVDRNENGTPLVSSIFARARGRARNPLMCYANADIIFVEDLLPSAEKVAARFDRFLLVGQRWDLEVREELDFGPQAVDSMRARLASAGRRHPPAGSDYFVFVRDQFTRIPDFALGRAGWDNWMIYAGRAAGVPVVDGSAEVTVIHQDHDYAHLPGGQPHYRLPESDSNVALAGGRETIFTLQDADWQLDGSGVRHRGWGAAGWARGLEAALVVRLGPGRWARLVRMCLHPATTVAYYWGALIRRLGRRRAVAASGRDR